MDALDNVDRATVVAVVIAANAPFIADPSLAANDTFVIAAMSLGALGVVGHVVKSYFSRG